MYWLPDRGVVRRASSCRRNVLDGLVSVGGMANALGMCEGR